MITYFGYGANQSAEMMHAMVGRIPEGIPASLTDFELVIQRGSEASEAVLRILRETWSDSEVADFKTYAIRPAQGSIVTGMAWQLSPEERELVDNWEINDGLWYQKIDVIVQTELGESVSASTEMIDDPSLSLATDLYSSPPLFLNQKSRMLEVAVKVRKEYLKSSQ